MNDHHLRWQSSAFALSLLIHAVLVWCLHALVVPPLSLPAIEARHSQPFTVKRVDVFPSPARPAPGPAGVSPLNGPNQSLTLDPSHQATVVAAAVQQATLANPPSPVELPAPRLPSPAEIAVSPSSTSVSVERSAVQAAISQFQNASSTNLFRFTPALPAELAGNGQGGKAGPISTGGGGAGPYPEGTPIPSFSSLIPGFRPPADGGLNGKLPEPVLIQLPTDILFDFDSSHLKPEASDLLNSALALVKKYSRATVDVLGHTDTIGADSYNQQLSESRALAVLQYLKKSLSSEAYFLRSRGFGKSRPLVNPNGNAVEQSRNRRVEIIIQALKD